MQFGELSVVEMPFEELSVEKMSVPGIVRSENCPSGKCLRETARRGNVRRRNGCWGTV